MLLWLIILALPAAMVACLLVLIFYEPRKARRMRLGQCTRCGYEMLQIDHTTCPECGHAWDED